MNLVKEIENIYGKISIINDTNYLKNTINMCHLPKILQNDPLIKELNIKSSCILVLNGKYYYVI